MKKIIHSFTVNHKGKRSALHWRSLVVTTLIEWSVSITGSGTNWSHVPPDWSQWGDGIISCQRCLIWIMGKDQTNSELMVIIQNNWLETFKSVKGIKDKEILRNCYRLKDTKETWQYWHISFQTWSCSFKGHCWTNWKNLNARSEN